MLMDVDSVDCDTKTMPCFWELLVALMQLLLFVDIVDVVLRGNSLWGSVPSWNYCWPKPLLTGVGLC